MRQKYASIIIDISHENVDKRFQYAIPKELDESIQIGTLVYVPFGNGNRRRKGYVVDISEIAEYDTTKIKEVAEIVSKGVLADSQLIQLAWWMKERYGATMNQALKTVLPVKKLVKARNKTIVKSIISEEIEPELSCQVTLNDEQELVVSTFEHDYKNGIRKPYLLHGVTGSGKTEVYMEMISYVLAQGKQAVVLIPEIALTYQTVMRFFRRFGNNICVMHSKLSQGERCDQVERVRSGKASIMIGPRSALFTPFSNLGIIIMDEEHEDAYKSETTPRYHAREVGIQLAQMHKAMFVMGSATPSMESYSKAQLGFFRLFTLTNRASENSEMAQVEIVDLREELKQGNKSIFSVALQNEIRHNLENGQQIMLFMNRRGYSRFISCRSCGEAIKCPHCDVSLIHHNDGSLRCHYCNYQIALPNQCPNCKSKYLAGFGIGTQQIEKMTKEMFPKARILRMDLDTTSKKGGHEQILSKFSKKQADILIGTQMIVKGHDFPSVTLVGILAADVSLYSPDYRATEKTFQLLVQAIGRAGRGNLKGKAIIQTYAKEHYSIQAASNQDYLDFYEKELSFRKMMSYPPMCKMLTVLVQGIEEALVENQVNEMKERIKENPITQLQLIGPANAPVYKIMDHYRKILYMKHENYDILLGIQKSLEEFCQVEIRYSQNNVQYDFS